MCDVIGDLAPGAVLWDFDGTLVDSERLWIFATQEVLGAFGVRWTHEQGVALCGSSQEVATRIWLGEAHQQLGRPLDIGATELYDAIYGWVVEYLRAEPLPWLPRVPELLGECRDAGIPMAVVSASPLDLLMAGIAKMPPGSFQAVLPGPQLPRPKPAPDGYLLAAERLGVAITDCVVIEDSVAGTAAGRAAGAAVLGVACMHPLDDAPGQINLASLAGVDLAGLTRYRQAIAGGGR